MQLEYPFRSEESDQGHDRHPESSRSEAENAAKSDHDDQQAEWSRRHGRADVSGKGSAHGGRRATEGTRHARGCPQGARETPRLR